MTNSNVIDIGFNMLLFDTYVTKDHMPIIKSLKDCGAKGIELPMFKGDASHYKELGAAIRDLGLLVTASVSVDADANLCTSPKAGVQFLKERIGWCVAAGAKKLSGPMVYPWGLRPEGVSAAELVALVEQQLAESVQYVREVAEYAEDNGVRLALEPLTHWELACLNTLRQVIDFVDAVDRPAFGVLIDTSHETLDGKGPREFREQVSRLAEMKKLFHVHISAPHRGDVSEAWINWYHIFGTLIKVGWNGPLVIEIFNAIEPLASAVHLNRPPYKDPIAVAKAAIERTASKWSGAQDFANRSRTPDFV